MGLKLIINNPWVKKSPTREELTSNVLPAELPTPVDTRPTLLLTSDSSDASSTRYETEELDASSVSISTPTPTHRAYGKDFYKRSSDVERATLRSIIQEAVKHPKEKKDPDPFYTTLILSVHLINRDVNINFSDTCFEGALKENLQRVLKEQGVTVDKH
ncbi:hypothetical protein DID80_07130 [Candidatus Marinamargulisbacteria bacterium SCGC AAA071-K20]|nr:hypothetical protein DID80_07130 [Candidatus Marinamargulisbacteria bacterium SCGC AAA071-K20]